MASVLHVGNIAHNAYFNELVLRKDGLQGCVVHFDAYHFASCPEWITLGKEGVDRELIGDDFFPNFFQFEKSEELRPKWFVQGPAFQSIAYLFTRYSNDGNVKAADIEVSLALLDYLRFKVISKRDYDAQYVFWSQEEFAHACSELKVHPTWRAWLDFGFQCDLRRQLFLNKLNEVASCGLEMVHMPLSKTLLQYYLEVSQASNRDQSNAERSRGSFSRFLRRALLLSKLQAFEPTLENILNPNTLKVWRSLGILKISDEEYDPSVRPELSDLDTVPYALVIPFWDRIREYFDYSIFYGPHVVIPACSTKKQPYAGYEHGTIRSLPFENSDLGRLVKTGYESASAVMITNADYVNACPKLEFSLDKIVYIPHGFDDESCSNFLAEYVPKKRDDGVIQFFAPARHSWVNGDDGNSKGNNLIVEAAKILVDRGIGNIFVTMIEYGPDVSATKGLISDNGLDSYFHWVPTMTRTELWSHYLDSHATLDQFLIPAIGQIGVESLALGARLINADDGSLAGFFGAPLPLLSANTAQEIATQMELVIDDAGDEVGLGVKAKLWFEKHHSQAALKKALRKTMAILDAASDAKLNAS
jgi:hypothetical protein